MRILKGGRRMLLSLHVKNLALIEEEEVTFTDGLNILTGLYQDRSGICPDRDGLSDRQ